MSGPPVVPAARSMQRRVWWLYFNRQSQTAFRSDPWEEPRDPLGNRVFSLPSPSNRNSWLATSRFFLKALRTQVSNSSQHVQMSM